MEVYCGKAKTVLGQGAKATGMSAALRGLSSKTDSSPSGNFTRSGLDAVCWKLLPQRLEEKQTGTRLTLLEVSVMVWRAVSSAGLGPLCTCPQCQNYYQLGC